MDDFSLRTILLTGLRRNELRLLRWSDWLTLDNVLIIRKSKTKTGIRRIPLVSEVSAMLQILRNNNKPSANDYIFSACGSRPSDPSHYRHICNRVTAAAGMQHITPHMLRHTFATRLIERGVDPKSVSLILGHKTVEFTLRHYVHPDFEHLRAQIQLISTKKTKSGNVAAFCLSSNELQE